MEVLYKHTLRKQAEEIAELKAQNAEMMGMVREMHGIVLAESSGNQHVGRVTVQVPGNKNQVAVDNRLQVNINVFGKEGLDHVTEARIRTILDESLARPALLEAASTAVLKTAMLVYSDPDHPENLTAYLPNKKKNDVLVRAESGWVVQPASLILPPMAQKSVDTLFNRQPFEDADDYAPLMRELTANEKSYVAGHELRPVLVRNKTLLQALKNFSAAETTSA